MQKILIAIVVTVAVAAELHAQAGKSQNMRMNNVRPGTFISTSRPTRVTGEGQTTQSGVKYWDIYSGSGEAAMKGHTVTVLYGAWLESGPMFASSMSDGRPSIFTLGVGQVIRGWEEGVEGMKVGGRRQLKIPAELAYGVSGVPGLVPPNATLTLDVELIGLQ